MTKSKIGDRVEWNGKKGTITDFHTVKPFRHEFSPVKRYTIRLDDGEIVSGLSSRDLKEVSSKEEYPSGTKSMERLQ